VKQILEVEIHEVSTMVKKLRERRSLCAANEGRSVAGVMASGSVTITT